jgi:AcrR family transcriptional regulator
VNKKDAIMKVAIRLFAAQGYETTTTLQVSREVGVTEPTIFYHFKNKRNFFNTVLEDASNAYMGKLEQLDLSRPTSFECIEAIIKFHFTIIEDEPQYMRILLRTCPSRLDDPDHKCTEIYQQARLQLKEKITHILKKGTNSGEFIQFDIDATANLLIAILNGLMRQKIAALDPLKGVESATIKFCRNALLVKK